MPREYRRKVDVESLVSVPVEPVLVDGFEESLKWGIGGTGTDFEGYRDTRQATDGDVSLYLITKATTPAAGDQVYAVRYPSIIRSRYIAIETMFRLSGAAGGAIYLYLNNLLVDPKDSKPYSYNIRLNNSGGKVEMETASGTWTDVGTIVPVAAGYWQKFSVMIDTFKNKVISADVANQYVKIDCQAYSGAAVTELYYQLAIVLETRTAARAAVNLDNVIVKASEI